MSATTGNAHRDDLPDTLEECHALIRRLAIMQADLEAQLKQPEKQFAANRTAKNFPQAERDGERNE